MESDGEAHYVAAQAFYILKICPHTFCGKLNLPGRMGLEVIGKVYSRCEGRSPDFIGAPGLRNRAGAA